MRRVAVRHSKCWGEPAAVKSIQRGDKQGRIFSINSNSTSTFKLKTDNGFIVKIRTYHETGEDFTARPAPGR
jgi:hypothetical protein